MRGLTRIGVAALALAACRQTVVFDQTRTDGGGADRGGGGGGQAACTGTPALVAPESPVLMVALDRSTGMSSKFGDTTQVAAARAALEEHALRYQHAVLFGYIDFPGSDSCTTQGGYCCAGEYKPPIPNVESFRRALHECDQNPACSFPGSLRPTPSAIKSSRPAFTGSTTTNGYMLLITNGQPDCASGSTMACTEAVTLIGALASQPTDVRTYVVAPAPVSFGDDDECLTEMALAGSPSGREPYYYVASPGELSNTIEAIIHTIAWDACRIDILSGTTQNADKMGVTWNNVPIPRGRDGWELTSQGRVILLHDEWCEYLIKGEGELAVYPICNPTGF